MKGGGGSAVLRTRAPAKVNLTLHVRGRRADGYHLLESLVAFAGAADLLELRPADALALEVEGPTSAASGPPEANLVLRAARALAERRPGLRLGAFRLVKRLPAAAGIGGGSSDAASALRLLARLNGWPVTDPAIVGAARATGADIPVCLDPRARMMRGIGEEIGPPAALPPLSCLLVNPGVAVPTADVFRALGLPPGAIRDREAHAEAPRGVDALHRMLAAARNDLEPPAIALAPAVAEALDLLRALDGCRLARMSGSGATVFGLFDDCRGAARAAAVVRAARPSWWVRPTLLR